jgi:uncharacterized protein YraI
MTAINRILLLPLVLLLSAVAAAQDSATVIVARANVRTQPTATATIVSSLPRGAVTAVAEQRDGWTRIQRTTIGGWVRSDLLAIRVTAAPTPHAINTPTPQTPVQAVRDTTPTSPRSVDVRPPAAVVEAWEYRNPETARTYALIWPGMGHLYSGEHLKGAALSVGTVAVLYSGMDRVFCRRGMLMMNYVRCAPGHTAVAIAAYLYGIVDARRSTDRMNARRGLIATARLQPILQTNDVGRPEVGLAVSLTR